MSNALLIKRIGKAYGDVYDLGDVALDILTDQPEYRKWLDAGHGDDYLEGLDKLALRALLEDIYLVIEEYAW